MKGQRVGYKRVSTIVQNTERQLSGVEVDRLFEDKVSGKDTNRPQLQELIKYVREGDTVIIHSMDRLARNLIDLRKLINDFTGRGVAVQFIKEGLTFTGQDSPMNVLLLNMLGAVAEFERAFILERQAEGIALAKERGAYKGRKQSLSDEQIALALAEVNQGIPKTKVAAKFGISRQTLYDYIAEFGSDASETA